MAQVRRARAVLASATLLTIALVGVMLAAPSPSIAATSTANESATPVSCGDLIVLAGEARCFSTISSPAAQRGVRSYAETTTPSGWWPQDIASMYDLPAIPSAVDVGTSPTVALVEVGDVKNSNGIAHRSGASTLAVQLAAYRQQFGLGTCSTTNSCLNVVSQTGSSSLPNTVSGWDVETMMDVEGVSAACPRCRILVVEAATQGVSNLAAALSYAASHASYVSMSWGFDDDGITASDVTTLSPGTPGPESIFAAHPDVTFVASTGDSGWSTDTADETCGGNADTSGGDSHSCTSFPASSTHVIAAGGTTVTESSVGGVDDWMQDVWGDTGDGTANGGGSASGCSGWTAMPAAQLENSNARAACGTTARGTADISALADGFAMYYEGSQDWWIGGGTSLAAPLLTAMYARAGNHTSPFDIYARANADATAFNDVTTGEATRGCPASDPTHLCSAGAGWDGPTGLGTPHGLTSLMVIDSTVPPDQVVDYPAQTPTSTPSPTRTPSTTTLRPIRHSGKVKVNGKARVRARLKASYGTFDAGTTATVTWLVNGKPVAHGKHLRVKKAWLKHRIRYVVTATGAGRTPLSLTSPTVKVKR